MAKTENDPVKIDLTTEGLCKMKLMVDGKDISKGVTSLSLDFEGGDMYPVLTLYVKGSADFHGEAILDIKQYE